MTRLTLDTKSQSLNPKFKNTMKERDLTETEETRDVETPVEDVEDVEVVEVPRVLLRD